MIPILAPRKATLSPRLDNTSILFCGGDDQTLTNTIINIDNDDDISSGLLSPVVEVTGYELPPSMLVPMINREEEIKQVVQRNPEILNQVQQQVDEAIFQKFKSTLFASRQVLTDHDWLNRIEKLLITLSPHMWERFQVLVDHFPQENDTVPENAAPTTPVTTEENVAEACSPCAATTSLISTPTFLSARPPFLAQLKDQQLMEESSASTVTSGASSFRYLYDDHSYFFNPRIRQKESLPAGLESFLNECKQVMNQHDHHIIAHWLSVSSSQVSDEHWEVALYECLNHYPTLFLKLKDLIDNELNEE